MSTIKHPGLGARAWGQQHPAPWTCVGCLRKRKASDPPGYFPAGTFSLLSAGEEMVCVECARRRLGLDPKGHDA